MSDHQPHSSNSQNAPASSWTEPPWSGWIETTGDALLILEAARRGLIPRVTRRLVDSERKMITSGSVFVFDEDESGIKRWTDGFFWSPSRILGNFLLYRETEKRGAGHRSARAERDANEDYAAEAVKTEGQSLSRPKAEASRLGIDRNRERVLVGSLTNSYKFKPGGMMKKTFSLTIGGVAQHLISYYKIEDVEQGRLRSPSTLPELAALDISPEYLDKTHFRNPPKVEIGVDGVPRYRGEADDIDNSPSHIPAPLSALPYDEPPSQGKRTKRYDPYGQPPTPKRRKGKASAAPPQEPAHAGPSNQSYPPPPVQSSAPPYPDHSLSGTTAQHYPPYPYYPGYHLPQAPVYSSGPPAPYAGGAPPASGSPPQESPSPPAAAPSPSTAPAPMPYPTYATDGSPIYPYYPASQGYPYPPPAPWQSHYPYASHAHPHAQPSGAVISHDEGEGGRGTTEGNAGGT
ncbi:hypothetical protein EUX98_g2513 [Antrodiella citrinella]|uniref:Uncharacterized protein n=1 Tax=Antrodiella citrinella TaxID=2447956 RepID=A0A4S4MYU5_9APHY|nr:hypothetical protein EUX98_g2513 [Antrodiella citrinella]